jgi:ligand-binding sensor protein
VQWSNELCPKIKGDQRGLSQICALANQTMAAKARETRLPVIDECDIGLAKVVVPIYADGEFLGTMGGCGRLFEDGEIETFLVSKTIDCPEEEVENLAESVGRISRSDTQGLADYLLGRVHEIVRENS